MWPNSTANKRIVSIDLLRGLVMVVMALDHTRDYFHHGTGGPMDFETTTPFFFFTRWITHFCAPVFVMLSGTSAFLYGSKKGRKEVSVFLFTRGIWLIFLEMTLVRLGWSFDLSFAAPFMFQVIWAIGCSMIALSALVWLHRHLILAIGLILIFFHNLSDPITFEPTQTGYTLWAILHDPSPLRVGPASIFTLYPILPWIGVMACGYALGQLFTTDFPSRKRNKILVMIGLAGLVIFTVLRGFNIYGDPNPWEEQKSILFTFLSFLDTEKYPPSLLFLLMTLSPALLSLSWLEKASGWLSHFFVTIGKVPLFYYLVHLYVIHGSAIIIFVLTGNSIRDIGMQHRPFGFPETFGFSLPWVYVAWICIVLLLYPLCRWYGNIKRNSTWKGWSYL